MYPDNILNIYRCSLQAAGNAVKRASDNLVRAAQKAAFGKADDDDVVVKTKFVGGIAQVGEYLSPEIGLPEIGLPTRSTYFT